jgi:hypothetical protein
MDSVGTWISVTLGLLGLVVAVLAYVRRQPKTKLEYFVQTNSALLPESLPETFSLTHRELEVANPSMTIRRRLDASDLSPSIALPAPSATALGYLTKRLRESTWCIRLVALRGQPEP